MTKRVNAIGSKEDFLPLIQVCNIFYTLLLNSQNIEPFF